MVRLLFSIVLSLLLIEWAVAADTISEMLKLIPSSIQVRNNSTINTREGVYIIDYARINKLFTTPPDRVYAQEFTNIIGDTSPFLSGFPEVNVYRTSIKKENIGFDANDVDAAIRAGNSTDEYEVIRGRFRSEAIESAIKNCTQAFCPEVSREVYEGCTLYDWGQDPFMTHPVLRYMRPARDSFGRLRPIGIQKTYVFRAPFLADIKRICDTTRGKEPSLFDQSDFAQLAQGMATHGVFSVFFKGSPPLYVKQDYAHPPFLRPYQAYGWGLGKDNNGKYTVLILVHSNESTAWENVKLLRERIAQTPSVRKSILIPYKDIVKSAEIRAGGKMVLAKLRSTFSWVEWLNEKELIIPEP